MHYIGHMFRILSCTISRRMTDALAEMELTSAQGRILGYLASCKEPPCPRDVEEIFHLSHPTVSGLLARLEKKSFIALRPDPEDRRCKRIFMLPKGWDCNEKIHKIIQENEDRIVQGFCQEEKEQFANFLTRATQNVGSELCVIAEEEMDS